MAQQRSSRVAGERSGDAAAGALSLDTLRRRDRALAELIEGGGDIILLLDRDGIIRDITVRDDELAREVGAAWLHQPMLDTVTRESRSKVETMLDLAPGATALRQEINHALAGDDLPIRYVTVRLPGGPLAAVGRDLRDIARLQQQLVDMSLSMERDYAIHRATELQSRVLFQTSPEAILITDLASRRIVDANPAAENLLRRVARQLAGTEVQALFGEECGPAVLEGFATARAVGQADWPPVRLRPSGAEVSVSAWLIRNSASSQLLLRLGLGPGAEASPPPFSAAFGDAWAGLRHLPEPLVATTAGLDIVDANEAFLDLVGVATLDQLRGAPLARFVGHHGGDLGRLKARLQEGASLRRLAASLSVGHGAADGVELSAGAAPGGGGPVFAFLARPAGAERGVAGEGRRPLKPAGEMTELVGRVPLREIVRETTDIIEELCIETALELTGDNRASAAEMLGLSRQSLYSKLRRFGLGELPDSEPN